MKTTPNTLSYDASILEEATIMRYGYLRPVIDEKKCINVGTKFINDATTHIAKSVNLCVIDRSARGEFMHLTPAAEDSDKPIVCHASVSNDSIKKAFGVDKLTKEHLDQTSRFLLHLVKCRFYYEYEYKRQAFSA